MNPTPMTSHQGNYQQKRRAAAEYNGSYPASRLTIERRSRLYVEAGLQLKAQFAEWQRKQLLNPDIKPQAKPAPVAGRRSSVTRLQRGRG